MKRQIIKIDESKCTGCGACITNCPEGALQIIDGKARLKSETACDGLGACIGHCPEDAITVEEREASAYDERTVVAQIASQGQNVLKAHLLHLKEHHQKEYLNQAIAYLNENRIPVPEIAKLQPAAQGLLHSGCPGSRQMSFDTNAALSDGAVKNSTASSLTQWPVQLHLISPGAEYFHKADLLVAADCTAYAFGNFHGHLLAGKKLIIACPKLDDEQEIYRNKVQALIDEAEVNIITVVIMQVPCCGGLLNLVMEAAASAKRKVPIKKVVVGIKGDILVEQWV